LFRQRTIAWFECPRRDDLGCLDALLCICLFDAVFDAPPDAYACPHSDEESEEEARYEAATEDKRVG